ncbi:MAG TPA: hypothetical protein VJ965_08090 [Anaerolineales bacterium]|nr:hypothetical protein [Anaerolineales bacterium]
MFRNLKFRAPVATIIAIASGIIMLFTYIFPLGGLRAFILDIVVIGAAAALLIGVANLTGVHLDKLRKGEKPVNSAALLIALGITFVVTLLQGYTNLYPASLPGSQWILTNIQMPVESTLMGILAITLTYAAARLITQRPNIFSVLFVLTLLVTLIGNTQFGLETGLGQTVRNFVSHGLASAGARGILIGVALGTIATGLRVLMGIDRPYGG